MTDHTKKALLIDAAWSVLSPIGGEFGLGSSTDLLRRLSAEPPAAVPENTVTMEQAAQRLSVSKRTIHEWQRKGLLPRIEVNSRVVRIPESAIAKMIGGRA